MTKRDDLLKQKAEIEKQLKELETGYVIRNKYDDSEVYVSEADNVRDAAIEAVKVKASLGEANFGEANLEGADLEEADLLGAYFWEANLRGANLEGANLKRADLEEADLLGANLEGADLGGAKFYGKGGTQRLKKTQVEHFLRALGFEIED